MGATALPSLKALWSSSLCGSAAVLAAAAAAADTHHSKATDELSVFKLASQNVAHFLSLSDRQLLRRYLAGLNNLSVCLVVTDRLLELPQCFRIAEGFLNRTNKYVAASSLSAVML